MNSYICRTCKTTVTFEQRFHRCLGACMQHGEAIAASVFYQPAYGKTNKQNTVPGYLKFAGSRARRVRRTAKVVMA